MHKIQSIKTLKGVNRFNVLSAQSYSVLMYANGICTASWSGEAIISRTGPYVYICIHRKRENVLRVTDVLLKWDM